VRCHPPLSKIPSWSHSCAPLCNLNATDGHAKRFHLASETQGLACGMLKQHLYLITLVALSSCATMDYESVEKDADFRSSIVEGQFIQLDAGHTYYNYSPGTGTPLVLVHSFSVPSYQWDHTTDLAIERGLPVISLDLYGRGNSSNPDTTYTVELFADQVIQLLDHLGIQEKVNLSGISMGGRVISQIASQQPDRINALIFVSPAGFADDAETAGPVAGSAITEEEIEEFIETDFPNRAEGQREDFLDKEGLDGWIDLYRPQLRFKHFARALLSTNRNAREMSEENKKIGQQDYPVHFIWGADDVVCPLEDGRYNALRWIPRAELHVVDACGHMPHIEKTEVFDRIFFDIIL
jgi:pimeloyl-ACP methyl ester carboxylesterase